MKVCKYTSSSVQLHQKPQIFKLCVTSSLTKHDFVVIMPAVMWGCFSPVTSESWLVLGNDKQLKIHAHTFINTCLCSTADCLLYWTLPWCWSSDYCALKKLMLTQCTFVIVCFIGIVKSPTCGYWCVLIVLEIALILLIHSFFLFMCVCVWIPPHFPSHTHTHKKKERVDEED